MNETDLVTAIQAAGGKIIKKGSGSVVVIADGGASGNGSVFVRKFAKIIWNASNDSCIELCAEKEISNKSDDFSKGQYDMKYGCIEAIQKDKVKL